MHSLNPQISQIWRALLLRMILDLMGGLDEAFKPISSGLDKKEVSMDKGDYEKDIKNY